MRETTHMTNPAPIQDPPAYVAAAVAPSKEKNVLGLVAFIISIVGFVFACIPGALILGWILLPIAFILSIVALFFKGKTKSLALTGLIVSIVGTIVGAVVFITVIATSIDEAFSGEETTVVAPTDEAEEAEVVEDEEVTEQGTRENPYPIGTAISQGDWTVTINSVNLDATSELTATDLYNSAPDAGSVYMLVNLTATYSGTNPDGETAWTTVDYVTADGNTIDSLSKLLLAPDSFDNITTLYEGASVTGNKALQIPADSASEGVLAINPTMFGDKVFVAVQ